VSKQARRDAAPIDRAEWQQRLDRMTELFGAMIVTAGDQSTRRCPYKNRSDECTAQFGCRNQRKPAVPGSLRLCAGDDKLDYRDAWASDSD
jgi:hypothetical protein